MRYADPTLCPDCRSPLPRGAAACPTCRLVLRHPLAVELFRTLHHADDLVAGLRVASAAPGPAATPAAPGPVPLPAPGPVPRPAPVVPPLLPRPERGGIGLGWIPRVLLGLGALCLLGAAITFLAVAWSHLGVGGRTAVLLAFTAATGSAALLLHRWGLRIAGESLVVVALGMLGLDVVGAGTAGWFGDLSAAAVATATGTTLLLAGTAAGLVRVARRPRLVAPQVVAGVGLLVADLGSLGATSHGLLASHLWVLVGGATVLLARRSGGPTLAWSAFGATALAWSLGLLGGLALSLEQPTVHELWLDGTGWSLLASAAALVVPGLVLRNREVLQWGGSAAALVVTAALAMPCLDTSVRTVELVALLITAGWAAGLALLPRVLRPVAVAPASIGAVVLTSLVLITAGFALERWWRAVEVADRAVGDHFRGATPVTAPALTVPSTVVVLAVLALLVGTEGRRPGPGWGVAAGVAAGVAGAVTIASSDVPVAYAVLVLALTAVAATLVALRSTGGLGTGAGVAALVVAAAAVVAGIAWPGLATAAAAAALGIALALHLRSGVPDVGVLAGVVVPMALATLVEAVAALAGLDPAWRGVPVLVAVGVVAVARAWTEIEVPAVLCGALCSVPAVVAAADPAGSLALHLTVAGFLVSATALVNEHRRDAAWAGAALLLLASWVRLADLGVHAPEAYTLPLAAALLALGAWRLRTSPATSTATALTPGLLLATVPSLLWTLDDPASPRAALLGLGAVVMTVAGAALRWSAPLVVGAAVGATVVLRELGPYAGDAPAWVWMALGGVLLVVVGVTWERRLLEVRNAVGLLGRLR